MKIYEAKTEKLTEKVNKSSVIVGDFNTHLSEVDRSSQKNK